MEITKIYRVESSHRVPGATTTRCRGLHGHSYQIEVSLSGSPINNACMVLDFAVLQDAIKPLVDSFDHTHLMCLGDEEKYIKFMQEDCVRWIIAPFNWSCEMMALMIFRFCEKILEYTEFSNGETPKVESVTVWETATGRCRVTESDVRKYFNDLWLTMIGFSDGVVKDWSPQLKAMFPAHGAPKAYQTKYVKDFMNMPGINI